MQEVQEGTEESDLATIRAWRENHRYPGTDGRLMKDHLIASLPSQYVMYEDLMRRLEREARCKPSMEKDASQARLIRGLQRLTELAVVRRGEWAQQNIVQHQKRLTEKALKVAVTAQAQLKVQDENEVQAATEKLAMIAQAQLNVQAYYKERETKRQKVRDEKEESGVGFSVGQLKFNRDKPENKARLEDHKDDYYNGPDCSNETHPEAIEHHAGETAYTWYDWVTNELICPVDACLPPVMTCISVTDAQHAELMKDM